MIFHDDGQARFYQGDVRDVLRTLDADSVHCVVTSPPYWGLRDYGVSGQLGLEPTPEEYVANMVDVFREVRRVLRPDGTLWLNIGDSYAGGAGGRGDSGNAIDGKPTSMKHSGERLARPRLDGIKPKDLVGIPWMLAFALRADGWWLRQDIIWAKPNPMPESVTDRCTKAHEYLFLLTKSERYWYDADAIREAAEWARWGDQTTPKEQQGSAKWIGPKSKDELQKRQTRPAGWADGPDHTAIGWATEQAQGRKNERSGQRTKVDLNANWEAAEAAGVAKDGRNKRSVWTIATEAYPEAHFATFPQALVRPCILAGCPEGGTVLDPFLGSGTTALVAKSLGRRAIGIELNPEYLDLAVKRTAQMGMMEVAL